MSTLINLSLGSIKKTCLAHFKIQFSSKLKVAAKISTKSSVMTEMQRAKDEGITLHTNVLKNTEICDI